MAELNTDGGSAGKGGKKRAKKQSTKVDMTPLVDLAFLLLTFFVLTSTFSQPKTMRMIFPEKVDNIDTKAPEIKDGHTILATKDNEIYYYRGQLKAETELIKTNLTAKGLRKILRGANKKLIIKLNKLEAEKQGVDEKDTAKLNRIERDFQTAKGEDKQIVIIKNDGDATYKSMIDIIDELAISNIIYYYPAEDGFIKLEETLIEKARKKAKKGGDE